MIPAEILPQESCQGRLQVKQMLCGPSGRGAIKMIKLEEQKFKLCLFDTNALSFIIKNKSTLINISNEYPFPEYIYAYSPYVLYEIGHNEELFDAYMELFSRFPSLLLKNEVELFFEQNKSNRNGIEPVIWSISPSSIIGEGSAHNKLQIAFSLAQIKQKFIIIQKTINDNYLVMCEFAEWAKKYPIDKHNKLLENRIIEAFAANCIGSYLKNAGIKDDLRKYLSNEVIRVMSTAWYYKFVSDRNRVTDINDVVDILNISSLSYCEVFIGERNINNVIEKIKTKNLCKSVKAINAIDYI